jgi:ACS family hexuronate transporter-like MFS transporter
MTRSRFRWVVIALIFFITVTNYVDRNAISFAIGDIGQQLGFAAGDKGLVLGAFGIGYAITVFFGGIWADHYGAHRTLAVACLVWSLAIGMTGLAAGFGMLVAARVGLGLAEGPNFPALNRTVADWLSSRERAIALSNSLVAVPLAGVVGGPVVTQLMAAFGWRSMFLVLMIIGLLWLPFWWFLFRDFPEHSPRVDDAELRHIRDGAESRRDGKPLEMHAARRHSPGLWRFLLTNPTLLANNWAFFVFGYALFFFFTWLPSYFQQAYQLNLKAIGLFTVLPWLLAAVLLWGCGYLSDFVLRRTGRLRLARSYPIWISQLLAAICILPLISTHELWVALIFVSLAVGLSLSANAAFYAINVDVVQERSGTALGVMDTLLALAGFVAPTVTGWLVEHTGSFASPFWVLAGLSLSSVVVVILFHKPDEARFSRT